MKMCVFFYKFGLHHNSKIKKEINYSEYYFDISRRMGAIKHNNNSFAKAKQIMLHKFVKRHDSRAVKRIDPQC